MATITLYAGKVNQMSRLINHAKKAIKEYKSDLKSLKSKVLKIDSSICNVDDVISSIKSSTQTQEDKIDALDNLKKDVNEFVADVVRIDGDVADAINQSKNDFYDKYEYLKPDCEKSWLEEKWDSAREWCKKHWDSFVEGLKEIINELAAKFIDLIGQFINTAPFAFFIAGLVITFYPTMKFIKYWTKKDLPGADQFVDDASKPFVVETFACRVEVLGTRFNVNADVQHSGFSTTLLRGSVRLTSLEDSRQQVVLKPDEKAVFENGKLTLHRADDPNEYLWVKGLISISGLDFKEVIHRMEHCYGVRINLNVAPIPTLEAMGKLRISDGIEHALGILQRNCKFNYMYNHETNEITIY